MKTVLPCLSIFAFPMGNKKSSFIASSDISKLNPYMSSFSNTITACGVKVTYEHRHVDFTAVKLV